MANIERKRLFIGVLILFGLSNALAMAAPNIWVMAVARFALALPVFWSLASATAVELVGPARRPRHRWWPSASWRQRCSAFPSAC